MKRSLRGVSRGLLALTLFAAVISFCPCESADSGMGDCCQPTELSIAGLCCVRESGSPKAVAPTPTLVSQNTPVPSAGLMVQPAPVILASSQPILVRPIVARAILRI